MHLRVEHIVRYLTHTQQLAYSLRMLDRGGTNQDRLPLGVKLRHLVGRRDIFLLRRLIDGIRLVDADHRPVCRDHDDLEPVYLLEFFRLGERGAGHTGELLVHAEIVLQRDCRERLILASHLHALFSLDSLVKTVRIAAAEHQAPRKFVYDDDLAVLDDVMDVTLEEVMRLKRLHDLMRERGVREVCEEVRQFHDALGLGDTLLRQREVALLLVKLEVRALHQLAGNSVSHAVGFGIVLRGAGDYQRRPRLVYQYRVDFVDDAEIMAALYLLLLLDRHIVA